jgi:hypothetical protein
MSAIAAALAAALLVAAGGQERKHRPFSMGVASWPHDLTPGAIEALHLFILDHTDLFAAKIDEGVPWPEALEKKPYSAEFESSLEWKRKYPQDKRVLLSLTPLNDDKSGLAGYRGKGEKEPLPPAWAKKDFDDPDVARAYLAFCREMIGRFRPDFVAYALEANQLAARNPARWKKFVPFARDLYAALKREHPGVQILVTLSADLLGDEAQESAQKKLIREILPYTDVVAVAAHPYFTQTNPAKIPKDYFAKVAQLAPGKPFAIAETGFPAEDSDILGFERVGKAAWQQDWLKTCLEEAARYNARFVVWMVPRDIDDLYKRIPPILNEPIRFIRDTGLLDGTGKPRKAFELWQQWLKIPRKP